MPKSVRVVPEDLHMSAATVDVHADNVHARHAAANGRIESAQTGLPTASAVALGAAVTKWQADTTAVFGQMVGHSEGMRLGAAAYLGIDQQSEAEITAAGDQMLDLGL